MYKVVDSNGQVVASYTYDAWGKVLTATGTMAEINPIRYRGYYYDSETGLYYLNSRYYDPETGRFVNADSYVSTGQGITAYNMFAYCLNDPVNYIDPTGELAYPGEIHNEVVRRIADKYGYYKEQHILYKNGHNYKKRRFGRADLISWDGKVWDVKRDKPGQIEAGKDQVKNYVNNTWAQFPDIPLSIGGNEIEERLFYYRSGLTTYKVTYRYAGYGVIAYDYKVSEFDYQTLAKCAAVVVLCAVAFKGIMAGIAAGSGLLGGALQPAWG